MSAETKHTPGPWEADTWVYRNKDNSTRKVLVVCNGEFRVCALDSDEGNDNPYTFTLEQAQANARLIAAAPQMLEALEAALHLHETPGDFMPDEVGHVWEDVEAAIRAAKGEA